MSDWKFQSNDLFRQDIVKDSHTVDLEYEIVVKANQKLQEWIAKAPVVYGVNGVFRAEDQHSAYTHQARLICIEEIKKCEHPKEKVKEITLYAWNTFISDPLDIYYTKSVTSSPSTGHKAVARCPQLDETFYKCECGAKVEPLSFGEVKEK